MSVRFQVEPGDVPAEKAARRLGLTVERFEELLPRLLSRGFPPSDPDTGNYDLTEIDAWRARRHARRLPNQPIPEHPSGLVMSRLERMDG